MTDNSERERINGRRRQTRAVMTLIGNLLDAWEGIPNDLKGDIRSFAPELAETLDSINNAMEDA